MGLTNICNVQKLFVSKWIEPSIWGFIPGRRRLFLLCVAKDFQDGESCRNIASLVCLGHWCKMEIWALQISTMSKSDWIKPSICELLPGRNPREETTYMYLHHGSNHLLAPCVAKHIQVGKFWGSIVSLKSASNIYCKIEISAFMGVLHPWNFFWRLCVFSQKIKQHRKRYQMHLIRNVPRNSKTTVSFQ